MYQQFADAVEDLATDMAKLQYEIWDNKFSANHRNKMIQAYGGTEAQIITVGELINLSR